MQNDCMLMGVRPGFFTTCEGASRAVGVNPITL